MPQIRAKVTLVEPMGAETYVYLTTGKNQFVARVDAHMPVREGMEIALPFDLPRAHIFHGETGATLV